MMVPVNRSDRRRHAKCDARTWIARSVPRTCGRPSGCALGGFFSTKERLSKRRRSGSDSGGLRTRGTHRLVCEIRRGSPEEISIRTESKSAGSAARRSVEQPAEWLHRLHGRCRRPDRGRKGTPVGHSWRAETDEVEGKRISRHFGKASGERAGAGHL